MKILINGKYIIYVVMFILGDQRSHQEWQEDKLVIYAYGKYILVINFLPRNPEDYSSLEYHNPIIKFINGRPLAI